MKWHDRLWYQAPRGCAWPLLPISLLCCTLILIAHRFSTVSLANRIVVLKKGRIVEQGAHDALIAKQGAYYKLYMTGHGRSIAA